MKLPENLKYTNDHEWVLVEGKTATVGITDYAQSELGEIVFVEVETVGETLKAEDVFGSVEAVKTVSELLLPLSGKIIEFNEKLEDAPELLNEDPYGEGWIVKVNIADESEIADLLSADEYRTLIQ